MEEKTPYEELVDALEAHWAALDYPVLNGEIPMSVLTRKRLVAAMESVIEPQIQKRLQTAVETLAAALKSHSEQGIKVRIQHDFDSRKPL